MDIYHVPDLLALAPYLANYTGQELQIQVFRIAEELFLLPCK